MDTVKRYGVHALALFGAVCLVALIVAKVRGASVPDAA